MFFFSLGINHTNRIGRFTCEHTVDDFAIGRKNLIGPKVALDASRWIEHIHQNLVFGMHCHAC